MEDKLTKDELEALAQIRRLRKGERESACVSRNAKRLAGLKYITCKGGVFALTEKGLQTLFLKRCIDGLRAVAYSVPGAIDPDVATFLSRKGLIAPRTVGEGFDVTERGRESLADIDSRENKPT
ncbi:MAG TPA: hypothetical protein VJ698_12445 [Noviherbaspirillum sp.]|uniref:hypothetical protein n=1 Tax=Noviherbaspirillum sp. TaxID=1926288 RepID=UPI002B48CCF1|nr:hypothetical protein [Noviherbaspirillum sp.]HJV86274.1 hypothetical protein [Noviherbaspirillum sp.]